MFVILPLLLGQLKPSLNQTFEANGGVGNKSIKVQHPQPFIAVLMRESGFNGASDQIQLIPGLIIALAWLPVHDEIVVVLSGIL